MKKKIIKDIRGLAGDIPDAFIYEVIQVNGKDLILAQADAVRDGNKDALEPLFDDAGDPVEMDIWYDQHVKVKKINHENKMKDLFKKYNNYKVLVDYVRQTKDEVMAKRPHLVKMEEQPKPLPFIMSDDCALAELQKANDGE